MGYLGEYKITETKRMLNILIKLLFRKIKTTSHTTYDSEYIYRYVHMSIQVINYEIFKISENFDNC